MTSERPALFSGIMSKHRMALPMEMAPHDLPNAAMAKALRLTALPTNAQTFTSGSLIRIQVPRRPNAFLIQGGTFLRFDVTVGGSTSTFVNGTGTPYAAGVTFDGHCSALINQLATYHNSVQLEVMQYYAQLYSTILESQVNKEQKSGNLAGGSGNFSIAGGGIDTRGAPLGEGNMVLQPGSTTTFCLPLISSLFGAGQINKYIPLDALNSDLIVELTLNDFRQAFVAWAQQTSGATWTNATAPSNPANVAAVISVSNVQLICQVADLDSSATEMYRRMHKGPIVLPVTQDRGYLSTLTGPLSASSVLVPARFQSVTGLIWSLYNVVNVNSLNAGSITWRNKANLSSISYRIGSLQYPARPLTVNQGGAEVFLESEKFFRSVSAVNGVVAYTRDEWLTDSTSSSTTGAAGAWLAAQDLTAFPHCQGSAYGGVSMLGANMFIDLTFDSGGLFPTTGSYNLIAHAQYDARLIIDETGSLRVEY